MKTNIKYKRLTVKEAKEIIEREIRRGYPGIGDDVFEEFAQHSEALSVFYLSRAYMENFPRFDAEFEIEIANSDEQLGGFPYRNTCFWINRLTEGHGTTADHFDDGKKREEFFESMDQRIKNGARFLLRPLCKCPYETDLSDCPFHGLSSNRWNWMDEPIE